MTSQDVSSFEVPSCISEMSAVLLRDAPGSQAGFPASWHFLCQYFNRYLLSVFFFVITRSPLWLLPSLHPLAYSHWWVTVSETTRYLVHLSCLLMCEVEQTSICVRDSSSGVTWEGLSVETRGYSTSLDKNNIHKWFDARYNTEEHKSNSWNES